MTLQEKINLIIKELEKELSIPITEFDYQTGDYILDQHIAREIAIETITELIDPEQKNSILDITAEEYVQELKHTIIDIKAE